MSSVVEKTYEANELLRLAELQLDEQKAAMLDELLDIDINKGLRNRLMQDIKMMRLFAVNVSPNQVDNELSCRIGYELSDHLTEWLREEAPKLDPEEAPVLSAFMHGGHVVQNKATAEDPMPQTGKRQAKVRGL